MERLTERFGNYVGNYIRVKGNKTIYSSEERKKSYLQNAIIRLAEYEDIGLEPKEVMALLDPPNPPLTLKELREMDGEPVWVEFQKC